MPYTFTQFERLKSKILIGRLFKEGKSFHKYPVRIVWLELEEKPSPNYPVQAAFTVPKRSFKRAVKRNRLRRLMQEAYRLNKSEFYQNLLRKEKKMAVMFIYTGKELVEYAKVERAILEIFRKVNF